MTTRSDRRATAPTANTRRTSDVWLTPNAAAERLGICPKTIYRLIAQGELPAHRIRGTRNLRIAAVDVDRMLAEVPAPGR